MSDNAQMRESAPEEQRPAVIADVIMRAIAEEEQADRVAESRNAAATALAFKVEG